ncbi:nitric oxide reductase activation protein NorD [Pseudooceanicola batsensis]|uniref:nitric oxide reductase activation protein NorD n=1 Tax=Pseudooceanicola batsensis TaxID=314255 RepID=UPI00058ED88E|nr:VWA domain-containing protein [Pseudooceanicola batsensis]
MPVSDLRLGEPATGSPSLSAASRAAFPGDGLAALSAARERLANAGYGGEVPRVFEAAACQVAELHGPETALALGPAASRIAIRAQPRVAALFLDTAVAMARKLDTETFARWLEVMLSLLRPAPAIVLPLLERMDMLIERLGLDMLEAWVATGMRFAANDAERRMAFFRLELPEAQRLLERHAGEDTFQSLERGLRAFHTALWGRMPPLREALPDGKGVAARRTSFAAGVIRMPASFPGHRGREAPLYRAALAHAGAHFAYGHGPFAVGQLKPMQIAVVSLIEDARVEALAMRDMPGLRRVWAPFHVVGPEGVATAPSLFARLAHALFDPDFPVRHGWIEKGVTMFRDHLDRIEDPAVSRHIGNLLGNDLGQTRVQFNARGYVVQPVYRDDNLGLWDFPDDPDQPPPPQEEMEIDSHDLRRSEAAETPGERQQEDRPPDADQPPEALSTRTVDPEAGVTVMHLPEYDPVARVERPEWVTVKEYDPAPGDPSFWHELEERHAGLLMRTEALVRMAQTGRTRRLKRQAEGESLDLDAVISAAIDYRSGRTPDHRLYEGTSPPERSIAVHLLLDMSRSTADRVGSQTVLSLERDAAAILARAMDRLGDPLAITAFASNGRDDLRTVPVKRFPDELGLLSGMALSGLTPGYSTRIGAALRLAGRSVSEVPCHRRLVLLLTDGEPSDVDVPDRDYLVADARRAVHGLSAKNIDTFCIALGSDVGDSVARIFGRTGFIRVERLESLPEKLTALYLRMSG